MRNGHRCCNNRPLLVDSDQAWAIPLLARLNRSSEFHGGRDPDDANLNCRCLARVLKKTLIRRWPGQRKTASGWKSQWAVAAHHTVIPSSAATAVPRVNGSK